MTSLEAIELGEKDDIEFGNYSNFDLPIISNALLFLIPVQPTPKKMKKGTKKGTTGSKKKDKSGTVKGPQKPQKNKGACI